MANASLRMGKSGLSDLETEEASIDGLYNDRSGYATFGVGHLVDKADKWPSFLLAAAMADTRWASCLKRRWPGKKAETVYFERAGLATSEFERLKDSATLLGRNVVANRRFARAYSALRPGEQQTVDAIVAAAIREEIRLLAFQTKDVLATDLSTYERSVRRHVTIDLTQHEFDALVSFTFNVGPGAFARSALLKRINEGKWRNGTVAERDAAIASINDEFLKYSKSGGKHVAALERRRQREAEKFLRGARKALNDLRMTSTGTMRTTGTMRLP